MYRVFKENTICSLSPSAKQILYGLRFPFKLSHAYVCDSRPSVLARRGLADEVYIRRDADHEQKERCEAPVLRMGHGVKFPCRLRIDIKGEQS